MFYHSAVWVRVAQVYFSEMRSRWDHLLVSYVTPTNEFNVFFEEPERKENRKKSVLKGTFSKYNKVQGLQNI